VQLAFARRCSQRPIIKAGGGITQACFVVFRGTIGQYRALAGKPAICPVMIGRFGQALKRIWEDSHAQTLSAPAAPPRRGRLCLLGLIAAFKFRPGPRLSA
jgi:hypothetical protein